MKTITLQINVTFDVTDAVDVLGEHTTSVALDRAITKSEAMKTFLSDLQMEILDVKDVPVAAVAISVDR